MSSDAEREARMKELLNDAWREYRPEVIDRVKELRKAADQARSGSITSSDRAAANATAHKLAGVLGTFGMREASKAASRIEMLLEPDVDLNQENASAFHCLLDDIDTAISHRSETA